MTEKVLSFQNTLQKTHCMCSSSLSPRPTVIMLRGGEGRGAVLIQTIDSNTLNSRKGVIVQLRRNAETENVPRLKLASCCLTMRQRHRTSTSETRNAYIVLVRKLYGKTLLHPLQIVDCSGALYICYTPSISFNLLPFLDSDAY